MNLSLKDRHLFGAGAAACAASCTAPLLTLLGEAGAAATVATFAFAGIVFGVVIAAGALFAVWNQRRRRQQCSDTPGPIEVEISTTRTATALNPPE
jgi:Na+/melibiose symporter-like transporter